MKKIAKILSLTILMCIFTASFNLCAVSAATAVYCSVCGEKITDCEYYDDDGNPLCDDCYENTEIEFDEDLSVYVSYETDGYEANVTITASIEDAIIYYTLDGEDPTDTSDIYNDMIVLYEDTTVKAFAQYGDLETEIAEIFIPVEEVVYEIECPHCGEIFEDNEDIYDDDGYAVCPYCDEYIDHEDDGYDDIYDTECPKCGKSIKVNDDICDDDGNPLCPYCNEYIADAEEDEIKFVASDWAKEEIYEAYEKNLIPDIILDTTPELYMGSCRADVAAVAVKLYEKIVGEVTYSDIEDTPFTDCSWFDRTKSSYIATAYKLGITKGETNTEFFPHYGISRQEIATMLYRTVKLAANYKPGNSKVGNLLRNFNTFYAGNYKTKFQDDSNIADYARESVCFMSDYGIIKGHDTGEFEPGEYASTEQVFIMSLRCFKTLFED